ncbi:MAG: PQQ-binding-like beta-propeller repeat protein [Kiloniellales bacterium]
MASRIVGAAMRRTAALLSAALLLTACGWFGTSEAPPLPGTRISVLALDAGLEADPTVSEVNVVLPPPYVNDAWAQPGGNPTHAMYHLDLGSPIAVAWRANVGKGSSDKRRILAQPVTAEGTIFTMDSMSTVTAFDASSGREVWRIDLANPDEREGYFGGGVAYEDGRLYVTTGFAQIFAVDALSGAVIWQQGAPAPFRAAPAVSGGRVFALTVDNQILAMAAEDGSRLWEHSGIQETAGLLGTASPAVAGSTVVVPYSSGEIFGLLAENGRVLWSDSLSAVRRVDPIADLAHIRGMPVIDRGLVVAISNSGRMVAIDERRGARAWDIDVGGIQMPWVAGDFIYVIANDAQIVCVTRRDGRIRWVQQLPRFENPEDQRGPILWFGPVLAGDRLIAAGSNRKALSISPYTGEILGESDLPGVPSVSPIVAGRTVYFLTDDATLIAMR